MDGYFKKQILIKNTAVKFLDWTDAPAGRYSSTTNVGGKLTADGMVTLDGTTALYPTIRGPGTWASCRVV